MAVEDRSLSEFPRALQVAEQALVMISNPDGLGGYDTNGAVLTEVGKTLLNVQYTQQLGNVSVFDAIKNTRVLSGTTTPLANEGANGQLYVKYQTVSDVDNVVGMYFKKDGAWLEISLGGGGGSSTLAGLSDVNLTSPADGQLLRYNGTSGKWENADIINDTTASTSSVYSSSKTDTLLSAKANSSDIPTKTSELTNNSGFITSSQAPMQRVFNGWTTSLTTNFERTQFVVMVSDITIYLVWVAGSAKDITVRNIASNTLQTSTSGVVEIDNITFTRTNTGLSTINVSATTNRTITIIG